MCKLVAQLGLCFCLAVASTASYAATYYVSPGGDDGSSGTTPSEPWRTIGAANARLTPGDTVYLRSGDYRNDPIEPARSGDEGAYITYAAYQDEVPVLSGASTTIMLDGRSYIRIRSIHVDGGAPWTSASVETWVSIRGGGHNIIEDGSFRYAKGWYGVRLAEDTHHNVIRGNQFDFVGAWRGDSSQDSDKGDVMGIVDDANRNLVEDNVFTHGGHNLLLVRGSYNVIRRNVFDNDWSDVEGPGKGNRNLSLAGGQYNLFESNVVRGAGQASDSAFPMAMKAEGRNQIVRRNLIIDNIHAAITTSARGGQPHASGNRIYHNTLHGNGGPAWQLNLYDSSLSVDDNVFINNLVVNHRRNPASSDDDADTRWNFGPSEYGLGSNRVINNLTICEGCDPVHAIVGLAGKISTQEAERRFPENFAATLQRLPQFVSADAGDMAGFALRQDSAGADEGAFLTHAVADGSGAVIEVEDAGFFFAGATIVSGDTIAIGDDRNLRVLDVDYDRNTLLINEEISWRKGEGVAQAYSGSAPDIGAVESATDEPKKPMAPAWR